MAGKIETSGGVQMASKRFSKEYKIEVVRQVKELGRSAQDVAQELGIHVNTLYKWLKDYENDGNSAFPGSGKLKPEDEELRRLRKELADLKEENEILKKAAAFFAKNLK